MDAVSRTGEINTQPVGAAAGFIWRIQADGLPGSAARTHCAVTKAGGAVMGLQAKAWCWANRFKKVGSLATAPTHFHGFHQSAFPTDCSHADYGQATFFAGTVSF